MQGQQLYSKLLISHKLKYQMQLRQQQPCAIIIKYNTNNIQKQTTHTYNIQNKQHNKIIQAIRYIINNYIVYMKGSC